jgi:acetolactate synthase I/II/III large subunit
MFLMHTVDYSLPAAVLTKVAAPHKTVIDIDGDASFSVAAMELQIASQFGIGVKVLAFNNGFRGMVLQWVSPLFERVANYAEQKRLLTRTSEI